MARHPETKKISAFVVETDWEGVKVEYRCRFMGLKARQRHHQLSQRACAVRKLAGRRGSRLGARA